MTPDCSPPMRFLKTTLWAATGLTLLGAGIFAFPGSAVGSVFGLPPEVPALYCAYLMHPVAAQLHVHLDGAPACCRKANALSRSIREGGRVPDLDGTLGFRGRWRFGGADAGWRRSSGCAVVRISASGRYRWRAPGDLAPGRQKKRVATAPDRGCRRRSRASTRCRA